MHPSDGYPARTASLTFSPTHHFTCYSTRPFPGRAETRPFPVAWVGPDRPFSPGALQ
jgi:hypothetical protein